MTLSRWNSREESRPGVLGEIRPSPGVIFVFSEPRLLLPLPPPGSVNWIWHGVVLLAHTEEEPPSDLQEQNLHLVVQHNSPALFLFLKNISLILLLSIQLIFNIIVVMAICKLRGKEQRKMLLSSLLPIR